MWVESDRASDLCNSACYYPSGRVNSHVWSPRLLTHAGVHCDRARPNWIFKKRAPAKGRGGGQVVRAGGERVEEREDGSRGGGDAGGGGCLVFFHGLTPSYGSSHTPPVPLPSSVRLTSSFIVFPLS